MSKNPIFNALVGLLYITGVVTLIFYAPAFLSIEETIFIPIAMLSLFVFSAACMGYIFLYQPLQLFLEGEKKKSVTLFLNTLLAFALSAATFVLMGVVITAYL